MDPLSPPNSHHLMAALGWLELGNTTEALAELERIEPELQNESATQAARLECLMAARQWDEAAPIAEALCTQCPEEAGFWLHFAYSTRRRTGGSLEAAYEILAPMQPVFPDQWLVSYNLACYLCQLDRLDEAQAMLDTARAGDGERVDDLAKDDKDLEPLQL